MNRFPPEIYCKSIKKRCDVMFKACQACTLSSLFIGLNKMPGDGWGSMPVYVLFARK